MGNKIDVSIVIVSTNEEKHIIKLLPTIYQTCDNLKFEIILIDNASTNNIKDIINRDYPNLKIIKNINHN